MKIALLNLQYDNNYGGNLQRYALMKVLQNMGHDVTHLNLRFNYNPASLFEKLWRIPRRLKYKLLKDHQSDLFPEYHTQLRYQRKCAVTDVFYYKYIKHTRTIGHKKDLSKFKNFDLFLVGSDQVWRKKIAAVYGIDTFMFDFLKEDVRRVAYGVSLGTAENELSKEDLERLTPLYSRFEAVSVREHSALDLFAQYGWQSPKAQCVLDPTLLLATEDYLALINDGTPTVFKGNLFCYILDPSEEKSNLINEIGEKKKLKSHISGIKGNQESIQQWLRNFYEAEYVVTDSYHGLVFSIIFNKPFLLIRNKFRGNARFEALMSICGLDSDDGSNVDWDKVNDRLSKMRLSSKTWLKNAVC